MRVATFDLETHDLVPQFGPIMCASVLVGKEMKTFRQDEYIKRKKAADMTDDAALCCDLRDYLESCHIIVGYFSTGFDITHLRTRLIIAEERPLKKMLHMDPIWCFRGWRGLRPMSSKLKYVTKLFNFEEKPEVPPATWLKARQGQKKAMDEIVDRCEADVRITAKVAEKAVELDLIASISKY